MFELKTSNVSPIKQSHTYDTDSISISSGGTHAFILRLLLGGTVLEILLGSTTLVRAFNRCARLTLYETTYRYHLRHTLMQ